MKHSIIITAAISTLLLTACEKKTAPATPAQTQVASLCAADEKVLFSCQSNENKLLSVCASQDLSASNGYVQYRYGANANAVEKTFPETRNQTQTAFQYQSGLLSFKNGSITYQVYNQGGVAGVRTSWAKDAKRNKNLACMGTVTDNLSELSGVLRSK
ncbi:peptidylprolyl isomerase PrsA family protein [Candidatus Venteria ishoeyi]|uniref:Uncharacterized protein n=1 Tax=Candidatus Venteria ishoeyi TaxID=1899563 RepID=A0A1H6FIG7_9GAMM|nr:hypothetical protein [Candidatus Venteria ishoeyi]MDM8548137.1 hypothetical protein [Candidatus Venteria ishoeyi]SEH09221.1 Uncharacterised protein [Candidatus Venteria ishoeyi]SEH09346.1 Uncharacterised protein [Candidatus Venteria ishoeyi]